MHAAHNVPPVLNRRASHPTRHTLTRNTHNQPIRQLQVRPQGSRTPPQTPSLPAGQCRKQCLITTTTHKPQQQGVLIRITGTIRQHGIRITQLSNVSEQRITTWTVPVTTRHCTHGGNHTTQVKALAAPRAYRHVVCTIRSTTHFTHNAIIISLAPRLLRPSRPCSSCQTHGSCCKRTAQPLCKQGYLSARVTAL
jgi:hypothetical protein